MRQEVANAFGKIFLTFEYDAERNYVYNNWIGYQSRESVIAGANASLTLIAELRCPYLLNDNTLVTGPWDHAVDWIATDWTPRAIAAGLRYFAHVVSPESFAALSAEAMFASIGTQFHMRIFGGIADARHWLQQAQAENAAS